VDAATALPDHWSVLKYDKLFLFSVPQQQRGCLGWVVWLFVAATAHEDEILINAHHLHSTFHYLPDNSATGGGK